MLSDSQRKFYEFLKVFVKFQIYFKSCFGRFWKYFGEYSADMLQRIEKSFKDFFGPIPRTFSGDLRTLFKKLCGRSADIYTFAKKLRTKKIWNTLFSSSKKILPEFLSLRKHFILRATTIHTTFSSEYTSAFRDLDENHFFLKFPRVSLFRSSLIFSNAFHFCTELLRAHHLEFQTISLYSIR